MKNTSLQKNSAVQLSIESLASDGAGVAHAGGMAVFVPFAAPGDVVDAKIVKVCKTHAFAIVQNVITPGPGRIAPECPVFGKCGGCALAHLTYEEELAQKQRFVADAMHRIGKLSCEVLPILPSPSAQGYRNKAQYPLCRDSEGHIRAGFYAPRSHRVVPCESCGLQPPVFSAVLHTACRLLEQMGASIYDEASHKGLVRHIYLRHAVRTNKVMVCLVCTRAQLAFEQAFCAALTAAHPEICSIILNVNPAATNVILGRQCRTLWGESTLADTLCGVPVQLSPLSFYQVNTLGAERLYGEVARMAQLASGNTLLDLYCGAGTIGLSMAAACGQLVGVEIVPEAVENARANAARMGAQNVRFLCADAASAAQQLLAEGLRPDVVVLDPPRKGCDEATLSAVATMAPRRVVMVSCNAATAARDAAWLAAHGYAPQAVRPVDMFPRTRHVETVVLLSQQKPDDTIEIDLDLDELDATAAETKATYEEIKAYVWDKHHLKVSSLYISQIKRKCGLEIGQNYNLSKSENPKVPKCPPEKEAAIMGALKHFQMI